LPELPEVETVRRGLAPALVGARIAKAQTRRADLRFPFPARFAARLKGRRVEALNRRAKYLIAELDDGQAWVTHLGMTGRWSIAGARKQPGDFYYSEPPDARHTHVVVALEGGVVLEFNDPRRFGYMDLIASEALDTHAWFKGLGPEPLGNSFHAAHLAVAFEAKKTSIKAAWMDQRVVAGLQYLCLRGALPRRDFAATRGGAGFSGAA
jgi:formamidopyrimidine-DNA glycosylase